MPRALIRVFILEGVRELGIGLSREDPERGLDQLLTDAVVVEAQHSLLTPGTWRDVDQRSGRRPWLMPARCLCERRRISVAVNFIE
jgi:hypothetical protein